MLHTLQTGGQLRLKWSAIFERQLASKTLMHEQRLLGPYVLSGGPLVVGSNISWPGL